MRSTALLPRQKRTIAGVAVLAAALVPFISAPSGAAEFCNATPIVFTPPSSPTQAVLPLAPYPSTIAVSGLGDSTTDVDVTLTGFNYPRPEDLDVLLVAPDGSTNVVVMSDIGGDNVFPGEAVSGVNLTFDDQAAGPPPLDSQLSSGTFDPADDDDDIDQFAPTDTFLAPAPAPSGTALSQFVGVSPNGTWSLYVVDDQPGPAVVGGFNGGWCIDIEASTVVTDPSTSSSSTSSSSTSTSSTSTSSTSTSSTSTTLTPTTSSSTSTSTSVLPSTTTTVVGGGCTGLTPTIVGTSGNDTITGTAGPDVIVGGDGHDTIDGLGGDDVICGQFGEDTIRGGDGNDTIRGGAGNDTIFGGNGNDDLSGGSGDDIVNGENGDDRAVGTEGADSITGGFGNDFLGGGDGNDVVNGGAGDDIIEGDLGDDRLVGGAGNDDLQGGRGVDVLNARTSDGAGFVDTLAGGPDADQCYSNPDDIPPNLAGTDC